MEKLLQVASSRSVDLANISQWMPLKSDIKFEGKTRKGKDGEPTVVVGTKNTEEDDSKKEKEKEKEKAKERPKTAQELLDESLKEIEKLKSTLKESKEKEGGNCLRANATDSHGISRAEEGT
eukprot:752414-Hanusia_phi.AAC.5